MAQGIVNRVVPASAFALGVVRCIVHGTFLASVLFTSFSALGSLPVTIMRPTGAMKFLPWSFYDQLQTPTCMVVLKTVMVLSLLLSTTGLLSVVSTKTSLLLVVFYQGLLRSFGHFNHDEMLAVYCLAVLAFTPCGDAFSLDSWMKDKRIRKGAKEKGPEENQAKKEQQVRKEEQVRKGGLPPLSGERGQAPLPDLFKAHGLLGKQQETKQRPAFSYAYPILLMQLLTAWTYFSSALIKLRIAGWKYLSPDNLPALAIFHSLDNLHDTHFKLAFWLPQVKSYLPIAVALILIWELAFPLAIFWRRVRWWLLGIGIVFHLATLFLMNIFFPVHLAMYLIFVDWDHLKFPKPAQQAKA